MSGSRESTDAASVRLYQSFERFKQFDANHVDFSEKISKLGSAPPKKAGPKAGQWSVAVHVPAPDRTAKPKRPASKQPEIRRWKGGGDGASTSADSRQAEAEAAVKSCAPASQVIKIKEKVKKDWTNGLLLQHALSAEADTENTGSEPMSVGDKLKHQLTCTQNINANASCK